MYLCLLTPEKDECMRQLNKDQQKQKYFHIEFYTN